MPRVLIIDGRNVKIYVSKGTLVISCGYRYGNGDSEIKLTRTGELPEQIIIRGNSYTITGDAIAWCELAKITKVGYSMGRKKKRTIQGIRVINIDTQTGTKEMGTTGYPRFREITSSDPERDRPDYRRLQMMCEPDMPLHDSLGLDIHRYLISQKLTEQATTLRERFVEINADRLTRLACDAMEGEHGDVKTAEGDGAGTYFDDTWKGHVLWNQTIKSCPDRWKVYAGRKSAVNKHYNNDATDPVNAALNYAYTILLIQTVVAMRVMRLDPEFSIDHSTHEKRRYAGAMDLMEPARPIVDRMILEYLTTMEFGKDDFYYHEDYAGNPETGYAGVPEQVSLGRKVRHDISAMAAEMFDAVAPHVEHVAGMLHTHTKLGAPMATVLTKSNHKAEQDKRNGRVA